MTIKYFHVETAVAVGTAILGLIAVIGAIQLGHGWSETGPEAGYFPFYIGVILIGASMWNMLVAVLKHRDTSPKDPLDDDINQPFLDRESAVRLAKFFAGMCAFLIVTLIMGIYVGSFGYVFWNAWRQGGYRLPVALSLGAGFAVALYLIFEIAFQMPLLKGPVEPLLGIY